MRTLYLNEALLLVDRTDADLRSDAGDSARSGLTIVGGAGPTAAVAGRLRRFQRSIKAGDKIEEVIRNGMKAKPMSVFLASEEFGKNATNVQCMETE